MNQPLSTEEAKAYWTGVYLHQLADWGITDVNINFHADGGTEITATMPDGEKITGQPAEQIPTAFDNASTVAEEYLEDLRKIEAEQAHRDADKDARDICDRVKEEIRRENREIERQAKEEAEEPGSPGR